VRRRARKRDLGHGDGAESGRDGGSAAVGSSVGAGRPDSSVGDDERSSASAALGVVSGSAIFSVPMASLPDGAQLVWRARVSL
jgi:hypothetical protein